MKAIMLGALSLFLLATIFVNADFTLKATPAPDGSGQYLNLIEYNKGAENFCLYKYKNRGINTQIVSDKLHFSILYSASQEPYGFKRVTGHVCEPNYSLLPDSAIGFGDGVQVALMMRTETQIAGGRNGQPVSRNEIDRNNVCAMSKDKTKRTVLMYIDCSALVGNSPGSQIQLKEDIKSLESELVNSGCLSLAGYIFNESYSSDTSCQAPELKSKYTRLQNLRKQEKELNRSSPVHKCFSIEEARAADKKWQCEAVAEACKQRFPEIANVLMNACKTTQPHDADSCRRLRNGVWNGTTCRPCANSEQPEDGRCVERQAANQQQCNAQNGVWHSGDGAYVAAYCEFCGALRADQSNHRCVSPSENEVDCHAKGSGYVFENGACKLCPQGLRISGNKCGCFQGHYMDGASCKICPDGQTTNGEGPNLINSCKPTQTIPAQPTPDPACATGLRKPNGQCCQNASGSGAMRICNDQDTTQPPPSVPEPRPASCRGQQGTAGDGQIRVGGQCSDCIGNSVPNAAKDACVPGTPAGQPKPGDSCVVQETGQQGVTAADGKTCSPIRQCLSGCAAPKQCVNGQCVTPQQECPQGQILQNGQCVPQQQQCKQDEEMIQGRCFPKKPNAQQPKEQPKQQQGPTPQQQQQQQMLQAMQECQMRQPPGAWQWNGFQCLPNPNYKPQNYGAQPSVTGGVVCNFFGSDAIEVPAGEQFSVTYDVSGAKREIKVDTSPKSTTQYQRQAPTTQPTNTGVLNQFGYGQDGSVPGTTVQTSQQGQATITAPKKKGKLKVSLIIDAVRQNSEACKPITVTVTDAVQQGSYDNSSGSSNYDSGSQYPASNVSEDTGPTIETPSEIIAQNRKTISSQPAQKAPEDDDAYAYLCKTLGIGCAKDVPDTSTAPSIRDLQLRSEPAQGSTREITIDPNAEDPADLPNIGDIPGESGNGQGQQQLATDIGVDGDNKKAYSTVLNYLGENGQYAEPIGPNSDNSGVLNSTDAEPPAQAEDRVGIFTRLWRWFLNLLGFGPEYVAA